MSTLSENLRYFAPALVLVLGSPQLSAQESDEDELASVDVRPVLMNVEITATTESGLSGKAIVRMDEDFERSPEVTITVH